MSSFRIGNRLIGPGHPTYFIAEAGSNHDGSFSQAKQLIDIAADAGADAVKFQMFRADKLYPRTAGMTDYLEIPRSIHEIIRELEMPLEWVPELAGYATERKIDFLSTPFDEKSADALDPYVAAFKIASYEMTHHALVQHCARKKKPLIVSTGTAYLEEVREMVEAVRAVGASELVLLQCTAKYPAPLDAIHLRTLATMEAAFGVPVGLSDHSREPLPAPMAAVALGASVIEKHFTLDNTLPGPDHQYALEPDELRDLIVKVRQVERTLGNGDKQPDPVEAELRSFARRSLFSIAPVAAGARLSARSVGVLRCGKLKYGMHPAAFVRVLGRTAQRDLAAEATLHASDVGAFVFERDGVSLRPMERGDAEHVVAWRNRPEVSSQLFSARGPTLDEHLLFFDQLQKRSDRVEFIILDQGTPVGTVGLSHIDFGDRSAELGVLVGEPAARGRGISQRACELLLDYAFDALACERVYLSVFRDNEAACRLYEKLGFVQTDVRPFEATGPTRSVVEMEYRGTHQHERSKG